MSRQPSPRMRKVNESVREVVADEIPHLTDPGLGFVTITGVDTSPDLRSAVVFYSSLGDEDEAEATAAALKRAAPHLQEELGRQLRMKYTPRLTFRIDESIARAARIDQILREIESEGEEE